MSGSENRPANLDDAPIDVPLRPLRGPADETWRVRMAEDLLSLSGPDGRLVMMLPREEAARHLRFSRDLVHGRAVSFVVVEGLRSHTFKCDLQTSRALLGWLPQKRQAALEREIQHYGMALVALGAALLVLQQVFFWGWGLAFVAMGLVGIGWPERSMPLVNGIFLLLAGMGLLFTPAALGVVPGAWAAESYTTITALGSVLLIWSIQQFSLLGPNHRLRTARAGQATAVPEGERRRSRLVRRVAGAATLFAVLFGGYAAALFLKALRSPAADWPSLPLFHDLVIFSALAVLTVGMACVLLVRRRPPYLEAKITAQMLTVVVVLYCWGLASSFGQGGTFSFSSGILAAGLLRFEQYYVWAPLIVLILLLDRWFVRAAGRELAEEGE